MYVSYLGCFLMKHKNQQAEILRATVMVVSPEKKERIVKGDQCDPTKEPSTVKSVFFSRTQGKKIVNGLNLPWMNGIYSFYRELDEGLFVWIHHHHG